MPDIKEQALSYLNRFASTKAQLRAALKRRAILSAEYYNEDPAPLLQAIEETLVWLEKKGLQSDKAYAEAKARSLAERGHASQRIAARLKAKGVDSALAKFAIAELAKEDDEDIDLAAARRYAKRRRLGCYRVSQDTTGPASSKDLAAMARAGFSLEIARRALKKNDDED